MKEIVFAGGCFWGVEEYMSRIKGVVDTKVGYANGETSNPSYEEVCKGGTGHVEACYVKFDEKIIELEKLLEKYWTIINPTVLNKQGNDIGHQYRTGIYYTNAEDLPVIKDSLSKEQKKYKQSIVTEVDSLTCFYEAEEYHQKYLKKNPNGYCHINFDM